MTLKTRKKPKKENPNTKFAPIVRLIKKHRSFLITTHVNPDGDGLGAESALYLALKKLGKKVQVVNHDPLPKKFDYLPFASIYQTSDKIPAHEVCFVLDAGNFGRIREGVRREEFGILVNIDHHFSNDNYGDHNLVLPKASATGEVVLQLIRALKVALDQGIAESVYTSLVTDTGGFRYSNTTPAVLRLAAELVDAGARAQKVSDRIFAGYSPQAMELVRLALGTVQISSGGKLATMTLTQADLKKSGAVEDDTENLINFVRKLEGVHIAVFLKERTDGKIKISLRSKTDLNVSDIAAHWDGGGHAYAAGAVLPGPIEKALKDVLAVCQAALK